MPPHAALIERLRAEAAARLVDAEPAHDLLHVLRVTETARAIALAEHADLDVVVPAALLHELFNYPKDHPDSARSGEVCAEHATALLDALEHPRALTERVAYAIRVHPFSRGVAPATLEARVLQDADRLDAIGAIGIARCFATCAQLRRPLYNPDDPLCEHRAPDDKRWGVDHFYKKLLRIESGLHTAAARAVAAERTRFMRAFLAQLGHELDPSGARADASADE